MQVGYAISNAYNSFSSYAIFKFVFASIASFCTYSLGYERLAIEVMAYLIVIDWILGVSYAIKRKNFKSWRFSLILYKLFFYFLLLIVAYQATRLALVPNWFKDTMALLIALTEIKSILENSALLGFKYAKNVEDKLNRYIEEKFN